MYTVLAPFLLHKMTIEQKIQSIGNDFRSLNRGAEIRGTYLFITEHKWTVTFICDGEMVETPQKGNMDDALDYAIEMIALARTKKSKGFSIT